MYFKSIKWKFEKFQITSVTDMKGILKLIGLKKFTVS